MKIHIVGSGCPNARPDRYGSAFVLETGEDKLLIDCGPATTYKMARMGLAATDIASVFLTHHHSDHNADLPCFVLNRWDQGIGTGPPLRLFGPEPTERFAEQLFGENGAFAIDLKARINHPASHACHQNRGGSLPRPGLKLETRDVDEGEVAAGSGWKATAARVQHVEPELISLAYRFDTDEGSVVFAGDCADCPALRQLAAGAGTLVITCTHFGVAGGADQRVVDVITGTREVASIANETGARRLVLTHLSPMFERPGVKERAIAEVARSCEAELFLPEELVTVGL